MWFAAFLLLLRDSWSDMCVKAETDDKFVVSFLHSCLNCGAKCFFFCIDNGEREIKQEPQLTIELQ